jgi:hypothetical protein
MKDDEGRAIAEAVSRWLLIAAAKFKSSTRDLWWTKWQWDRFSPSAKFRSTNCSTVTIIYHLGLVQ